MFLAKLLDQKQGESRVVDRQQTLRERLDSWLKTRPSEAHLAERGILGRRQRFANARVVVERLLWSRLQAKEEERVRIPAGSFHYTRRVCELLSGTGDGIPPSGELEKRLEAAAVERTRLQAGLEAAAASWSAASGECRKVPGVGLLAASVVDAGRVFQDLAAHHAWTGNRLAGVFTDLGAFQRLAARKSSLQKIIAVLEKTDAIRTAAFAWGSADALPLATLEEIPGLCTCLPARSRAVGLSRVQFVVGPIRTSLLHSLQEALSATGRWPVDPAASKAPTAESDDAALARAIQGCADLQRLQSVGNDVQRLLRPLVASSAEMKKVKGGDKPWACAALAEPLIARFRHHFWRAESDLCRMDKPEWAFRYLIDTLSAQKAELERWLAATLGARTAGAAPGSPVQELDALCLAQVEALRGIDLTAGLCLAIADEASLFLRARMPLLAPVKARPALLHTIHHFVRFHGDISALGGSSAGAAAFADFDANRPVTAEDAAPAKLGGHSRLNPQESSMPRSVQDAQTSAGVPAPDLGGAGSLLMAGISHLRKADPEHPDADGTMVQEVHQADSRIGKVGARLMAGLSQLRPLAPASATAGPQRPDSSAFDDSSPTASAGVGSGCLDLWAAADAAFLSGKISGATASDGSAWQAYPLRLGPSERMASEGGGPEAAKLVTLVIDLFERAGERAGCLSSSASQAIYSRTVLEAGLYQVVAAVRLRWNPMVDPFEEVQKAALLTETLEELCRFLDDFPLAVHIVAGIDEVNALRLSMLTALVDSLEGLTQRALRSVSAEPCVFSSLLAPRLVALSRQLRPSGFVAVAQRFVGRLATLLGGHLLQRTPFTDDEQLEMFVANCRNDLHSVLVTVIEKDELQAMRAFWDGCNLLGLPKAAAEGAMVLLKRAVCGSRDGSAVAPALALWPHSGLAPGGAEEPQDRESLQGQVREALEKAGVEQMTAPEALAVLAKRPDLASIAADIPGTTASALQELLPTGVAQTTMQLGASALQQLAAAGAQASLQTKVADLRSFAGDAGRLFTGKLCSTLDMGAMSP